jgi:hypothetical protein
MAELPASATHSAEVDAPSEAPMTERFGDRRDLDSLRMIGKIAPEPMTAGRSSRRLLVGGEALRLHGRILPRQVAVGLGQDVVAGHVDEALVGVAAAGERLVQLGLALQRREGNHHRAAGRQQARLALGIDLEVVRLLVEPDEAYAVALELLPALLIAFERES